MKTLRKISKLLILGSTGLVGSRFISLTSKKYSITTLGRNNTKIKVDLLSKEDVEKNIQNLDADAAINFAAFTNVDLAEKEKGNKEGEVYILNSLLPLWLAKSCKNSGKKLYHISTDYVFKGTQENRPYNEKDSPKPVDSWYAITKFMGEENILNLSGDINSTVARVSYPYSGLYKRKFDIARAIIENLKNGKEYFGIEDQKIKPASVDDITQALSFLLENNTTGIYHIAGNYSPNSFITPYEFAKKIARLMNLDLSLIKPISFKDLSKRRIAPRPQHTWLDTQKIESLGFSITSIEKALQRFKKQFLEGN